MKRIENKKTETEGAMVYIGPSFIGIVERNTAYRSGLPQKVKALIDQYPYLRGLLIPVEELAEAKKELMKTGSEKYMLYQRAIKIGGIKGV